MSVSYVPIQELTDEQWAQAHDAFYSLPLARQMGARGEGMEKPPLMDFYNGTMDRVEQDLLRAWALVEGDEYLGHVVLVRHGNDWEIGTALVDPDRWGQGYAYRAARHVLRELFSDPEVHFVLAFANTPDGHARELLLKAGFRPHQNYLLLARSTWESRDKKGAAGSK